MLFQQIEKNKRKTFLLVVLFCTLVLAIGWAFGFAIQGDHFSGLIVSAIVLIIYVPLTYKTASAQVLRMAGAKEIQKEDHPMLYNIVEDLAMVARIPTPKIYIVNDPTPNAFATGIKPEKGAVAFTTGLLERLNREELEGVAAHEIAHIRNYDIRLMTICIALVGVIAILADLGRRMLFYGGNNRNRSSNSKGNPMMIVAIILIILSPLAARFVSLAVSRNREYLADATAVEFTRNSTGLKNALLKISSSTTKVKGANASTASMYISNPFAKDRKRSFNLFATHPPIQSRIERLERM